MTNIERAKSAQAPIQRYPRSCRVLRMTQVEAKVGLRKSKIYELMAAGEFPRNFPLAGSRARGFLESEIDAWIALRVELREATA